MKNITLHTFKEKRPDDGAIIIWFASDHAGFCSIRTGTVEYYWEDDEGTSVQYDAETDCALDMAEQGYTLTYSIDNETGFEDDTDNWIVIEDGYNEELDDISHLPSFGR